MQRSQGSLRDTSVCSGQRHHQVQETEFQKEYVLLPRAATKAATSSASVVHLDAVSQRLLRGEESHGSQRVRGLVGVFMERYGGKREECSTSRAQWQERYSNIHEASNPKQQATPLNVSSGGGA